MQSKIQNKQKNEEKNKEQQNLILNTESTLNLDQGQKIQENKEDLSKNNEKTQNQDQQQNDDKEQNSNKQSSSNSGQDIIYDENDNGKFFDILTLKPFDLKSQWLGNTDHLLQKFQEKFTQISHSQHQLKKGFQLFQQNQAKYISNSLKYQNLRKNFEIFDKKKIYEQFINNSRKPLQKLHPSLLLNIGSYIESNLWYFLAKMRRVAKIFNMIYNSQDIVSYFSEKDLGSTIVADRKQLDKICKKWLQFQKTFLYYKQIKYTDQIPPNSFKNDLEQSVLFLNDIYRRLFNTSNFGMTYFKLINQFMKTHRVVIALSTLSLTNLIMIRKPSIVAFSNFLALNKQARKKQQITKTKYYKVIKIVQDQDYRDCLIINTKVANYLQEQKKYQFSVYILYSIAGKTESNKLFLQNIATYNILMYHKHNDLKSKFVRDVPLVGGNVIDTGDQGMKLIFSEENQVLTCVFEYISQIQYLKFKFVKGTYMNCLLRNNQKQQNYPRFSQCYLYNEEYYYIIVIKNFVEKQCEENGGQIYNENQQQIMNVADYYY